jgi:ATP-binding cassette subfamily F protein 3
VLLLDEPTNHLDIRSRDALADALADYEGTVIIISHDRYFIDQVCQRVIELDEGRLVSYPGNYSYFKDKKKQKASLIAAEAQAIKKKNGKKLSVYEPSVKEKLEKEALRLEDHVAEAERRLVAVEAAMEDPSNMADEEKMKELVEEYTNSKVDLEEKILAWEQKSMELEEINNSEVIE